MRGVFFACVLALSTAAAAAPSQAARADEPVARAAARALAHGRYSEAEALARAKGPTDPSAAAVLAHLAIVRGRYEDALALLQPAAAAYPTSDAALELGRLQAYLGRRAPAERTLAPILAAVRALKTPSDLLRAGRAARAAGEYRTANALLRDAAALAKADPEINTAWGDLFLEKYDRANATRSYEDALKGDTTWAPAHLGLARALADEDPPLAAAAARKAIEIDPNLTGAHLLLAELALDEGRRGEARQAVARALEVNARSLEALALAAALDNLEGRSPEFEAGVARILAINPAYGGAYRVAGSLLARQYRFDEAVAITRRAIEIDPDSTRAAADLGMHLMRTGDEREARRQLERAFRVDPYDVVTYNLLQLLDTLDTFETVRAGDAVVRLDPKEAPVLSPYATAVVEDAIATLSKRYGFTPRGPILVQVFSRHDDFAVRTLGLPGMLGALGASFGRVVTLDSPRARPPGTFNWQATLHHEMAHVFTLQMSGNRLPRWLSEGVSVHEEGRVRPEWARDTEVPFARAWDRGEVLKLTDLPSGFTNPETIALSYFQASLVVELILERHGESGLHALLRAYGEGLEDDAAMQKALGTTLGGLQGAFDDRMRQRFASLGRALRAPEGVDVTKARDVAAVRELASRYRDSYPLQMAAGRALLAADDRAQAFTAFERAAELVPTAAGPDSPRALMAALAERSGDTARARRELQTLLAYDHTNVTASRALADLAEKAGDAGAQLLAYERITTIDPFDPVPHAALGRLARQRGDLRVAIREFQAAIAAGPVDIVSAQCDLGEALLLAGRKSDAKRAALAALEIAPTYERAQALLLRCIGGD